MLLSLENEWQCLLNLKKITNILITKITNILITNISNFL